MVLSSWALLATFEMLAVNGYKSLLFAVAKLLENVLVFDVQDKEVYIKLLLETTLLLENDAAFDANVDIGTNIVARLLP